MTAQALNTLVLALPDTPWDAQSVSLVPINPNISLTHSNYKNIQTLSRNTAGSSNPINGLLYVPDLPPSDPCTNITAPYVPQNVTRRHDLPPIDYALIALAPWVSINCTISYMAAASFDPIRGFIFFQPGNDTEKPPPVSDPTWTLKDGGRWKTTYSYPVYAIPGAMGSTLIRELSQYSGNTSRVPHGQEIEGMLPKNNYIRLSAKVVLANNSPSLPSLWVFLIIVLGILLGIVGITSGVMHLMQRNRRQSLRRRIRAGDIDLEAIGLKRITVPTDLLNKMPLVTYHPSHVAVKEDENKTSQDLPSKGDVETPHSESGERGDTTLVPSEPETTPFTTKLPKTDLSFSQSTCAICLDDFITDETTVRELPCRHVFHPECVDGFLQNTSSLCPMCKKSVLPSGYCPPVITNAMVRRERFHRRPHRRSRRTVDGPAEQMMNGILQTHQRLYAQSRAPTTVSAPASAITNPRTRTRSVTLGGALTGLPRRVSNALSRRESSAPTPSTVEMDGMPSGSAPAVQQRDPAETQRRRASAADRLAAAMAQRGTGEDEEMERERRMPRWRKMAGRVFPALQ